MAAWIDAPQGGEQFSGRAVRVDACGILRVEQILEGRVGGDPPHYDVEFPTGVAVVEDDRLTGCDVALPRGRHPHLDRLAARFHLAVVPREQTHVVLAR